MTQKQNQLPPDDEPKMEDLSAGLDQESATTPPPEQPAEPKFKPLPGEKHLMHLEIDQEAGYDSRTGKKISTPRIIKGEEKELKSFIETAPKLGYKIKVLYTPNRKG